ncbi:MAG: hypothetical protein HYT89_06535 [Candidatus Omnitrophica bacterium]|nr:hypothetical protein [Candidatus Omnitrophota bacterium]
MQDSQTRLLDKKILEFIHRHADRPSTEVDFQALAYAVFEYQFERNSHYRKFCLLEGKSPGRLKSWKDIPAMPAAGFKELVLATFPLRNAVRTFRTSGTTGQNKGAHLFDTLKLYEAAILPSFKKYLLPDGVNLSFYFLISPPAESRHSSLSHMMGVVSRHFAGGKGRYYAEKEKILLGALLRDLRRERKKVFLLATAFSLKAFLDFLKAKKIGLRLPGGSRLMETGGFKGRMKEVSKTALYAECKERLGLAPECCVSEYGMTELSSQFYDTTLADAAAGIKRKPFKTGPAWTRTLVVDPVTGRETKNGARGVLRHFDLANRGSVLAVQTEDFGRRSGEGFELLGRARGAELRGCSLSYEEFLAKTG